MTTSKAPTASRLRNRAALRVRILPKDPLVARRDGQWPVEVSVDAPTAGDGPSSARVVIVDYNADLDARFAPARLLKDESGFRGLASLSNEKLLESFAFHQTNVWAIIENTLARLEDDHALARPIPWASGLGRLLVLPHAGYMENAFYDRATGALHFFYFEGPDGKTVYTCLSHDIITHELGHAVLDGLKPGYNEISSPETAGFHEYFGDAIAMMASLRNRSTALSLTADAPSRLKPKNIVSAIATEFGAAIHGLSGEDYLRGAWKTRTVAQLKGTYEEHDWSEVLTGVYYDLLQYLYRHNLSEVLKSNFAASRKRVPARQNDCVRALIRAADQTANVMLRALDYCPPVDLRYDEYARALLRADEVAYPADDYGIREELQRSFKKHGLKPLAEDPAFNASIMRALRGVEEIDTAVATPADAYRFVDSHRKLFGVPFDANLRIVTAYRTSKRAASGFRAPRERIIEFAWSEDVALVGGQFGALAGKTMPLQCGGTLVFDSNGNFLHMSLVLPTRQRRVELNAYVRHLVREGSVGISDGVQGIGAPGTAAFRIAACVEGGRVSFHHNAAMRHVRPGAGHRH